MHFFLPVQLYFECSCLCTYVCWWMYVCVCHCASIFSYCLSYSVHLSSYVHVYTVECGSLYMSVHCAFTMACMSVYPLCMCLYMCVFLDVSTVCLRVHFCVHMWKCSYTYCVHLCKCERVSLSMHVQCVLVHACVRVSVCMCLCLCISTREEIQQDEFLIMLWTYNHCIFF